MTRYYILDKLLSSRYEMNTIDDLVNKVNMNLAEIDSSVDGVVRRTIEKDLAYLESAGFGIEIERYSKSVYDGEKGKNVTRKYVRYRNPGDSIFKRPLTGDESYLLSEVLSLMGKFEGLPEMQGLDNLKKSLEIKSGRNIISLDKNPLGNSNLFAWLFTAISNKQVVELNYQWFETQVKEEGAPVSRRLVVCPYFLKEYNRRWFLLASDYTDRRIWVLGLERISEFKVLDSYTYIEPDFTVADFFEDVIGVTNFKDKKPLTIQFWVSDKSREYVESKPLHDSQIKFNASTSEKMRVLYPKLPSGAFFSIQCKENYELIRELSSFGPELVVLSPAEVQQKVVERLRKMLEIYGTMPNSYNDA